MRHCLTPPKKRKAQSTRSHFPLPSVRVSRFHRHIGSVACNVLFRNRPSATSTRFWEIGTFRLWPWSPAYSRDNNPRLRHRTIKRSCGSLAPCGHLLVIHWEHNYPQYNRGGILYKTWQSALHVNLFNGSALTTSSEPTPLSWRQMNTVTHSFLVRRKNEKVN